MAKELNKFILEGEELEIADVSARATAEDAESLANVANAKANAVDAELTRQVGILDNKIESVDDKADNYYNTLDGKIDSQGDTLENMIDNVNSSLTTKINEQGVPAGGTDGQILAKDGSTNYATKWVTQSQPQPAESEIDDSITASNRTWSSSKISSELESVGTNILDDSSTTNNKTWSSQKISSEIQGSVISEIDDSVTASNKTWSSQKINTNDTSLNTRINSTQQLTASRNTSALATKTYSAGDYLIYNDKLYKTTTSIAQGATLSVGVNITLTDVASELNTLRGNSGMVALDYNNPLFVFSGIMGGYSYTTVQECYLVGVIGYNQTDSILNITSYTGMRVKNSTFIPPLKLKAGVTVSVVGGEQGLYILKAL